MLSLIKLLLALFDFRLTLGIHRANIFAYEFS